MRVVILTSPRHFYGNYLVKKVLESQNLCQVVGIVESEVVLSGKSLGQSLRSLLKKSGFFFFFRQSLKKSIFNTAFFLNRIFNFRGPNGIFDYYEKLADDRGIPSHSTPDVNRKETVEFIRSCSPDLVIILLFVQILEKSAIDIPRLGCINFHPSFLPRNRGLMPVFAALANADTETGATIHRVGETVDSGQIVARKSIAIEKDDTEHSLYSKICRIGADLLVDVLRDSANGGEFPAIDASSEEVSYCSIPDLSAVQRFRRGGRKMFRFRELFRPFEAF